MSYTRLFIHPSSARIKIIHPAEQSSVGRGRMYDRVVGWGRRGYIGQEGCRGWGRIDEQFSVGCSRIKQGMTQVLC